MSTSVLVINQPELRRLYDYWREKKGERAAPRRADIAPEEIVEILPFVFLVEIEGERLRFRLVGSAVTEEYGGRLSGMYIDEVDFNHATAQLVDEYRRAAHDIVPIASRWNYEKNNGRQLTYERIILPLSADGKSVNMFLCGAVGRGIG